MHNEVEAKLTGRHALLIVLHVRGLLLDYSSLYREKLMVTITSGAGVFVTLPNPSTSVKSEPLS